MWNDGGGKRPPYRMRFSWRTTTRRAHCPALHGTYFVGVGPRPTRLICILGPPYIYFMGMFRRQRAATHFANSGKVGKTPFKGEIFRFISPLKIPLFTDQSGGPRPPYWMYPPGTGDGRRRKNDAGKELHHPTPSHHGGTPGEARLSG